MEPMVGLEPTKGFPLLVYKTSAVATEPHRRDVNWSHRLESNQILSCYCFAGRPITVLAR